MRTPAPIRPSPSNIHGGSTNNTLLSNLSATIFLPSFGFFSGHWLSILDSFLLMSVQHGFTPFLPLYDLPLEVTA